MSFAFLRVRDATYAGQFLTRGRERVRSSPQFEGRLGRMLRHAGARVLRRNRLAGPRLSHGGEARRALNPGYR